MDLKVFIATHKPYDMPAEAVYQPLHVGAANASTRLPYERDDSGENISRLNHTYCELTGLYWAWKNTDHDAYGLVHYRRYFAGNRGLAASGMEMEGMLAGCDVVLPSKRHYVVQTVAQHYGSAHHASDLAALRQALESVDSSALNAYDQTMRARSLSLYNMFLMRKPLFTEYCDWLFRVLDLTRANIPLDSYGPQQARVMGYLGERLLNVWVTKEPSLKIDQHKVLELERQSTSVKGMRMLGRMVGIGRAD